MTSVLPLSPNIKTIAATLANSSSAHTTTLGPFTISATLQGGFYLIMLDVRFGVPSAAAAGDCTLTDILGTTIMTFHVNLSISPAPGYVLQVILPLPGLLSQGVSAAQQQWSFNNPAITNGPGYSVNMMAYIA